MKKVIEYLKKVLNENDKVVIACSGGPDSMALFSILLQIRDELKLELICAHINHNKRKESESEALMVEKFCKENKVLFEYTKFENYEKGNFEAIARKKRYDFFEEVLKRNEAHILMTAHHADDLAETVLMRIARGSTLKGYGGFPKYSHDEWYELYRPLVYVEKKDLLDYVIKNNIPYAIDNSNNSDELTRNRYRHHILVEMKKEEPNITAKILNYSEKINEAADYIDEIVREKINDMYFEQSLDLVKLSYEKDYLKKMIIKKLLSDIYVDDVIYLKEKHVDCILDMIDSYRPNITTVLPKNIRVVKRYNKLLFTSKEELQEKYALVFDEKVEVNNHIIEEVDESETDGNDICRLSIQDVVLPLYVRNRENGDRMKVKGLSGTKKIKDIFIEAKISPEERDKWPILVDSHGEILWIPNIKKSKYNKSKDEKCDIILKYQ